MRWLRLLNTVEATSEQRGPGVLSSRERQVFEAAGAVRLAIAQKYADRHKLFEKKGNSDDYKFLWVTDFPFFEWDEETKSWTFAHHPFTSPHEDDLKAGRLTSDPGSVRSLAYDIVLNGMELGSGSIRIHRQDVQQQIFRALGMSREEAKARFGFFLDALEYGTPPHGGIALRAGQDCDDSGWSTEPARGDRLSEDREGDRSDGGCSDRSKRDAVEGTAHPDSVEELGA